MPWSNQSGGGGGGGPWRPGNKPGPWGTGPQGGGGGGGGGTPPDLEELFRRSQDRIKNFLPGGGPVSGRTLAALALAAVAMWLATGVYIVRTNEVGLNLIFGRYDSLSGEGLHYNLPYPIGSVTKVSVETQRIIPIGVRAEAGRRTGGARPAIEESMMLTGDENIVDIDFAVQWQINRAAPQNYIFNLQNPDAAIKAVAEAAMREVVGRRNIQAILTTDRQAIEAEVRQLMQETLNGYGAGVLVSAIQLQRADPPGQVIDAFRDVQAARQDQDRLKNEAETYASRVVPESRGEATRIVQGSEAYRERVVAEAQGQASRFRQVFEEYRKAPDVTRDRLFLETMERVLGGMDKVIIDQNGQGGGVVPYLPLNEIGRRGGTSPQGQGAVGGQAQVGQAQGIAR